MIALFVRKDLLSSSIRRHPPNRANGVAVFDGSPILYNNSLLYRLGLPSNTATPLALFVRIELLSICSCLRQQVRVATNMAIAAQIMTTCIKYSRGQRFNWANIGTQS